MSEPSTPTKELFTVFGDSWKATSLADFWTRWNPVVHVALRELLEEVKSWLGDRWFVTAPTFLVIFFVVGLLHDIGWLFLDLMLSQTDQQDFTPSLFFAIFFLLNGIIVVAERFIRIRLPIPNFMKTILTFLCLIVLVKLALMIDYWLFW